MVQEKLISETEQIHKYLRDLALKDSTGIIRPVKATTLGVKFRFGRTKFNEKPFGIQLVDISQYGLNKLKDYKELQIEVFGQDRRVSFKSDLLKVSKYGIWVSVPVEVSKSERRQRQRYLTNEDHLPFFDPGNWAVEPDDISAPPVFGLYKPLAAWTLVVDISFGGLCVETRFPSIVNWVESNPHFKESMVQLPMKKGFQVETELRWTKRIRERVVTEDGLTLSIQKYKFGMQFIEPSREFLQSLTEFLKVMQITENKG
ncbi:hypothetical protein [Pseudobacteriovorax antillogorgiicola]|uniref:PilZ domain-containing protein n=1 Tax=Pseudobacteriovorax antillogorgiicola TaxID=1513793 RepID=A0A1Y6CK08_9BACT|nr:hypothetical protein [Pseudobacteriovorax antillogorgiicola]TCS48329.1 hypothetical protein EDD56_118109 [Pseudobacteriovorax antillogorgiicola]SMF56505.1 hypothetical protein SAMN06296036_11832 [Pseudobacteriovorax antillogorgiicola]